MSSTKSCKAGDVFGKLTIESIYKPEVGLSRCVCICECGRKKDLVLKNLVSGNSKTCGKCVDKSHNHLFKHGLRYTREYKVWLGMKDRCYNVYNKRYNDYGGRGIFVCEEWVNNPAAFCSWMIGNGSCEGMQIDRIDNNGPYSPSNCRVVTLQENCWNKRPIEHTSKYKGVSIRSNGKFRAKTSHNGVQYNLGTYDTEEEAALAYNKKVLELKGEYAYVNTVKEPL